MLALPFIFMRAKSTMPDFEEVHFCNLSHEERSNLRARFARIHTKISLGDLGSPYGTGAELMEWALVI